MVFQISLFTYQLTKFKFEELIFHHIFGMSATALKNIWKSG